VYVTSDLNKLGKHEFHVPAPGDDKWYPADIDISIYTQKDFQVYLLCLWQSHISYKLLFLCSVYFYV